MEHYDEITPFGPKEYEKPGINAFHPRRPEAGLLIDENANIHVPTDEEIRQLNMFPLYPLDFAGQGKDVTAIKIDK